MRHRPILRMIQTKGSGSKDVLRAVEPGLQQMAQSLASLAGSDACTDVISTLSGVELVTADDI